jgi:hypothetical protein
MSAPRDCGTCTLCCKIMEITELSKPAGSWCPNCRAGVGCTIYGQHPPSCKAFRCGYLNGAVPEAWRPNQSHMVVTFKSGPNYPFIHVDPGYPDAWRKEPFYSQIRQWAVDLAKSDGVVLVGVNHYLTVVFPVGEKYLGIVPPDKVIATGQRATPRGIEYIAVLRDRPNH